MLALHSFKCSDAMSVVTAVCDSVASLRSALAQPNRYPTQVIASNKMLSKIGEAIAWEEASAIWQNRNYWALFRKEKSRILDEFVAVTGHHRKHGIRLLGQSGDDGEPQLAAKKGRRIYNKAVGEALIVFWARLYA